MYYLILHVYITNLINNNSNEYKQEDSSVLSYHRIEEGN